MNQNTIALSTDRGSLEIAGVSLLYEGSRVKSYLLGRDLNPAGRGFGDYYPHGAFSIGLLRPISSSTPIFGWGNSINNGCGGGCGSVPPNGSGSGRISGPPQKAPKFTEDELERMASLLTRFNFRFFPCVCYAVCAEPCNIEDWGRYIAQMNMGLDPDKPCCERDIWQGGWKPSCIYCPGDCDWYGAGVELCNLLHKDKNPPGDCKCLLRGESGDTYPQPIPLGKSPSIKPIDCKHAIDDAIDWAKSCINNYLNECSSADPHLADLLTCASRKFDTLHFKCAKDGECCFNVPLIAGVPIPPMLPIPIPIPPYNIKRVCCNDSVIAWNCLTGTVLLCNGWQSQSRDQKALTLIHEALHSCVVWSGDQNNPQTGADTMAQAVMRCCIDHPPVSGSGH